MIFVTVGTHEQQFNRLIKYIDELIEKGMIYDNVVMQIGYSDYTPKHATYSKFYTYNEMQKLYNDADIIITHGGPSSFMEALKMKKKLIVVPRKSIYKEHVNNHQCYFCNFLSKKNIGVLVANDIDEIYSNICLLNKPKCDDKMFDSNNDNFCKNFSNIISQII